MSKQETPFDRCIITVFLRDVLGNEVREPIKTTWVDTAIPVALFSFLMCVFLFVHFFPDGIWG